MPTVDRMNESVNTINDLVGMGLLDQAEKLLRSSVGEWGRRTELVRAEELIAAIRDRAGVEKGKGNKHCTVCGSSFDEFSPLPAQLIENMIRYRYKYMARSEMTSFDEYSCPACGASDRERLYAAWIEHEATVRRFSGVERLIHFAPEPALSKKIRSMNLFCDYKTADVSMPDVDYHVDITGLPFEDESFDFFICSHILEHVADQDKAMSELFRITSKGGCGILMVPITVGLKHTIEGSGAESREERWRHFGQDDHIRLYAHDDFVSKVTGHGFKLMELGVDYFGEALFRSLGLRETSILYVVEKW